MELLVEQVGRVVVLLHLVQVLRRVRRRVVGGVGAMVVCRIVFVRVGAVPVLVTRRTAHTGFVPWLPRQTTVVGIQI